MAVAPEVRKDAPVISVWHETPGPEGAPAVALMGGIGGDARSWSGVVPALAEHFRVLVLERRGHGGTPAPSGPYTLADLGGDILETLDAAGAERAHLVGLSLGGMEALWVAANAPHRVDRVVAVCTSAFTQGQEMWAARAAAVRSGGMPAVVDATVGRRFTPAWAAAHPEAVAVSRDQVLGTDPEGYAACGEVVGSVDLRADLPQVAAPVLAVAGEDDLVFPAPHLAAIASAVRHGRLVTVPGAHLPIVESPADVVAAVVGHLATAEGAFA